MTLLCESVIPEPAQYQEAWKAVVVPEHLCSQYKHPGKEEAVAAHRSRFSSV